MKNVQDERLPGTKKFVIEFVNPDTGCICDDVVVEIDDVAGLSRIVNGDDSGFHPTEQYALDAVTLDKLSRQLGLSLSNVRGDAHLRTWVVIDELPYKVHTNRELELMLRGEKPLASFCEEFPSIAEFELIPERHFLPHVEARRFSVFEYIIDGQNSRKIRYVLYTTTGEEWRAPAYMLLKMAAARSGWNEGFERMEGSLLGYEDWQNDAFIELVFRRRIRSGSPGRS